MTISLPAMWSSIFNRERERERELCCCRYCKMPKVVYLPLAVSRVYDVDFCPRNYEIQGGKNSHAYHTPDVTKHKKISYWELSGWTHGKGGWSQLNLQDTSQVGKDVSPRPKEGFLPEPEHHDLIPAIVTYGPKEQLWTVPTWSDFQKSRIVYN